MPTASRSSDLRDPVEAVLAAHLPPGRAAAVAAALPAGEAGVRAACNALLELVGATPESLLLALVEDGGLRVDAAARAVGATLVDANRWLDLDSQLDPASHEPPPRRFRAARSTVRFVWLGIAAVGIAAVVQSQGGLVPCQTAVCVDSVDLLIAPDEIGDAEKPSVRDPDEVIGLRYAHRATSPYVGILTWTVDGIEVQVSRVVWAGAGRSTVLWVEGAMPAGVHRVTVTDEAVDSANERSSITFVVRSLPGLG